MTLYERITQEVIDADPWLGNWTEHKYVEHFSAPNHSPHDVHLKCKKRWLDHGFIEAAHLWGRRSWQDGEIVCPGDYLITHEQPGKEPEFTIVIGHVFEKTYREQQPSKPTIIPFSVWEASTKETQDAYIANARGAGVLVVPDEMMTGHG